MSTALEGVHRTRILLYLLREGKQDKATISNTLTITPRTLNDQLDVLIQAGLLMQTVERRGIRKIQAHVISLTPPGKQVAELLARVDEIVVRAKKTAQK